MQVMFISSLLIVSRLNLFYCGFAHRFQALYSILISCGIEKKTSIFLLSVKSINRHLCLFDETNFFKIAKKKDWKFNLISNYKHAYQNSKWRRFGLDFDFNKKLNSNWTISGGFANNYRFDKELGDFYELRPKIGIEYKISIFENVILKNININLSPLPLLQKCILSFVNKLFRLRKVKKV